MSISKNSVSIFVAFFLGLSSMSCAPSNSSSMGSTMGPSPDTPSRSLTTLTPLGDHPTEPAHQNLSPGDEVKFKIEGQLDRPSHAPLNTIDQIIRS